MAWLFSEAQVFGYFILFAFYREIMHVRMKRCVCVYEYLIKWKRMHVYARELARMSVCKLEAECEGVNLCVITCVGGWARVITREVGSLQD